MKNGKNGISAINYKIYGMRFNVPENMRKAPRPIDGKELETTCKKCAWTALKIINGKSGISRAELSKHIDDATQAAALEYCEKGKPAKIEKDIIRAMCRAAAKVINNEIFNGGKNSGDYDTEMKKRENIAAGNVNALDIVITNDRRAEIINNINPRRRALANTILIAREKGYKHQEIFRALNIPEQTYYRIIKELKRAALATM